MTYIVQQRTKAHGVEVWLDARVCGNDKTAQDFARVIRDGAMNRSDVRVVQTVEEV